jgi:hypothetical protein
MKKVCVLLFGLVFLCSGFLWAQGKGKMSKGKAAMVEASGAALWSHLEKVDYSKKWKMWPGKTALYEGTEPHGALLTTYVNGVALKAIQEKKGTLPAGSIVAKENYTPDKKYAALTVMYKVPGYNPAANDWFWAKYTPDGKIEAEGKIEGCINCHGKKRTNDFIFTGPLK